MSTELVIIEKQNVLAVFTEQGQIDPILEKIAIDARSIIADVSTAKGRKEIASVAYRVAQSKTYLDGLGKDLVADMKELPKKVDASRKQMRDFLDSLRDEVRLPLDQWEAEQAAIEAKREEEAKAAALLVQIEAEHEIALLMDESFNRAVEDKRKAEEQAQREREAQIAADAAAKARAEAEAVAKAEKDAAEQRERDALLAKERAEQESAWAAQALKDAESKAAQDKLDAEQRATEAKAAAEKALKDAEAAAELKAQQAAQGERDRAAAEQKRVDDETARRNADQEHKRGINRKAVADLVAAGLSESDATKALTAIVKGLVAKVTINY